MKLVVTLAVSRTDERHMSKSNNLYPIRTPALVVKQPLGDFYVVQLPAKVLLDTAYSDRLEAVQDVDGSYTLEGSQRQLAEPRLKQIGEYINSVEAAFPNTIILAANYRQQDGTLEEEIADQWKLTFESQDQLATIEIPKPLKMAAIIDGQHRLFGFNYARKELLNFPLVCAVYFGLPKPYQAFLFATINSTQKSVDKSQTYELFGYNVEEEPPDAWSPDKLAVFLARKLNTDPDSPFCHRIVIAAENDIVSTMAEARRAGAWMVSTATVVEGIVRLISKNPKADSNRMHTKRLGAGRSRSLLENAAPSDKTPLRQYYLQNNDKLIYTLVRNYFQAVEAVLWRGASAKSYIRKTVGVQAIFDVLRTLAARAVSEKDISRSMFEQRLAITKKIDFADDFYQASGTGRQRIRNTLELSLGIRNIDDIKEGDQRSYRRLCGL